MNRNIYILLVGKSGVGKTTIAAFLKKSLSKQGLTLVEEQPEMDSKAWEVLVKESEFLNKVFLNFELPNSPAPLTHPDASGGSTAPSPGAGPA